MEQKSFRDRPSVVIWEPTRACDLTCVHCRAAAQPRRSSYELTTEEGFRLIDQVADLGPELFVITGGDPLKRPDIYNFVEYAEARGLIPSLNVSPTALLNDDAIKELKSRGLARLAISIDGPTAETNDAVRGVPGLFDTTLRAIRTALRLGLPVEVNTELTRESIPQIDDIARLLDTLNVVTWNVFFPVPSGPGRDGDLLSAAEVEDLFRRLYDHWLTVDYQIEPVEAQHYRRYIRQRQAAEMPHAGHARREAVATTAFGRTARAARGVDSVIFISSLGDVSPSGFLPLAAGNIRMNPLAKIYYESPLFVSLRASENLRGRCGVCEYREICGGSRARAWAVNGDVMSEDPLCAYEPAVEAEASA